QQSADEQQSGAHRASSGTARQLVEPAESSEQPEAEGHGQLAGRRDEAEAEPRARVLLGAMVALLVVDVAEIGRHDRVEGSQVQRITDDTHALLEEQRGQDECRRGAHQEAARPGATGSDTASRRARNASATSGALPDTTSAARGPNGWAMAPSSRLPKGAMP